MRVVYLLKIKRTTIVLMPRMVMNSVVGSIWNGIVVVVTRVVVVVEKSVLVPNRVVVVGMKAVENAVVFSKKVVVVGAKVVVVVRRVLVIVEAERDIELVVAGRPLLVI